MFFSHIDEIEKSTVEMQDVNNAEVQILVGPKEGWKDNAMRLFTLGKDGHTPKHKHDWPHINYILSGEGTLLMDGKLKKLTAGSVAYVENNTEHQFQNTGNLELKFICIVPTLS